MENFTRENFQIFSWQRIWFTDPFFDYPVQDWLFLSEQNTTLIRIQLARQDLSSWKLGLKYRIFLSYIKKIQLSKTFYCCKILQYWFMRLRQLLTDTGEKVQRWTRVFSTRRWVILVARTRRKKREEKSVFTFGGFRLWTSFESSSVSVNSFSKPDFPSSNKINPVTPFIKRTWKQWLLNSGNFKTLFLKL